MYALLNATSTIEQVIGFFGVLLGAGNAAGGYVVTERMLEMFKPSDKKKKAASAAMDN
jgi:H+-translocating NAD(P) transhydrogenase subunit alpha